MRHKAVLHGADRWGRLALPHLAQEFLKPSRLIAFAAGATLIVVVGPFGTFDKPIAWRAGFWVSWFACVWVVTTLLFSLIHKLAGRDGLGAWRFSLLAWIASVPMAALFGVTLATQFFPRLRVTWENLLAEAIFLSPIAACVVLLLHMTQSAEDVSQDRATPEDPDPEIGAAFFARLPKEIGRELLCLSVSDHYLNVQTAAGEALVLGSLSEAVAQLEGYAGCQVHRSHWVAFAAVDDRVWVDQKLQLTLSNGAVVPVSRSFRPQLLEHLAAHRG